MTTVHIAGHLGSDPEVRFTSGGQKVTVLRVATNVRKGGKDETIWWRVTIWGEQFDKMMPYFKKGSAVMIVGELNKPEIFTDREGKPQISMGLTAFSIQFSPFGKPDRSSSAGNEASHTESRAQSAEPSSEMALSSGPKTFGESRHEDDEVPF